MLYAFFFTSILNMSYPLQLVLSELQAHKSTINQYHQELSFNLAQLEASAQPDVALIKSQPELLLDLRAPLLDFLMKVAQRTKLLDGVFYSAVKLFDRYCSRRVVLKLQAQLVGCTCIWLAAKHQGGSNHTVNSVNRPIPGRAGGPTQRARIPRLVEFVQLCGPSCGYDEGMFIQMERHILNTLDWSILQPTTYDWLFSLHELQAQASPELLDFKRMYYMKCFMASLSLYSGYFISLSGAQTSGLIKKLLLILILNQPDHFGLSDHNLQKILDDNKLTAEPSGTYANCGAYTSSCPQDGLSHFDTLKDNSEINRLIYAIATVSNTVYQSFTATPHREINDMIAKIHKVAVSHIMALKEEEKELKRKESPVYIQSTSYSSSSLLPYPDDQRSPSVYSASSTSDYDDSYSMFSKNYEPASQLPTPLPSPSVESKINRGIDRVDVAR